MRHEPSILIASGGSGGHLFPAFSVAEEIERRWPEARVTLTTGPRDIEREVCETAGRRATILPLPVAAGWKRRPVQFAKALLAARRVAHELLKVMRPNVIVGTGGFTMAPVISAAQRSRTPVVLLEQNAIPGRATRWFAPRSAVVCSSFDVIDRRLKGSRVVVTGNPVRSAIAALADTPPRNGGSLLVLGGSQGARALNESLAVIAETSPALLSSWRVLHQTGGEESAREVSSAYQRNGIRADVRPFFSDMAEIYSRTGLVIARAGATTLAELACTGAPAILIPYPHARDRHQHANARVFAEQSAALVVEQGNETRVTVRRLQQALESLASEESRTAMSREMRRLARPRAAQCVLDVIDRLMS